MEVQIWPEVDYLAGLRSYKLLHGLLWYSPIGCTRSRIYNAPSWSWASVEGAVSVHSHHGIFYDNLVEIVDASTVTSPPTSKYATVTDGYVRLKGPLLQARIIKEDKGISYRHHMGLIQVLPNSLAKEFDGILNIKLKAFIFWDDSSFGHIWQVVNAFLMPFQVSISEDLGATWLSLCGIILSPNTSHKGQYQRIGFFEIEDRPGVDNSWVSQSESSSEESPMESSEFGNFNSTGTSYETHSCRTTGGMLGSASIKESTQEPPVDETEPVRHLITYFEGEDVSKQIKEERKKLPKLLELNALSKRPLANTIANPSDRSHSVAYDKYCNGVIDVTLAHRYDNQLEHHVYPNINSFLTTVVIQSDLEVRSNHEYWDKLYEECHGSGIFTIRIV